MNKLRYYNGTYDWYRLLNDCSDIDLCHHKFLETLYWLIDVCIPCKLVTVGPRDPDFITPRVKLLLRQRYRLRKRGRTKKAGAVAS